MEILLSPLLIVNIFVKKLLFSFTWSSSCSLLACPCMICSHKLPCHNPPDTPHSANLVCAAPGLLRSLVAGFIHEEDDPTAATGSTPTMSEHRCHTEDHGAWQLLTDRAAPPPANAILCFSAECICSRADYLTKKAEK